MPRLDSTLPSSSELMICAAAREITDGAVVFVGMRLPLLAFMLAKRLHAPQAVGFFESGVIRDFPAAELLYTMADGPNLKHAVACTTMADLMGMMQKGRVDLGFLGAAEVDQSGQLNSTLVRGGERTVRLPGSGGACDIASLAKRLVVVMRQERRRLPNQVSYVTCPPCPGGLTVITDRCCLRSQPKEQGKLDLFSLHAGEDFESVQQETGWKLTGTDRVTEVPGNEELQVIRDLDPERIWTA